MMIMIMRVKFILFLSYINKDFASPLNVFVAGVCLAAIRDGSYIGCAVAFALGLALCYGSEKLHKAMA